MVDQWVVLMVDLWVWKVAAAKDDWLDAYWAVQKVVLLVVRMESC